MIGRTHGRFWKDFDALPAAIQKLAREKYALYRAPHSKDWQRIDLDKAMDMIADRLIKTRDETWEWESQGKRTRRTMGFASLGGATLDNEENYLIKKLFTALGAIQIENQARI